MPYMTPYLNTAVRAARAAGQIIARANNNISQIGVRAKAGNDFVSEVDVACEQVIREMLLSSYPQHALLGEERGMTMGPAAGDSAEWTWIVDPIDGTANFLHGFPHYAVSIALRHEGQIVEAVVLDAAKGELFTATRGAGAFCEGRRIRVSGRERLGESLIGTGFPFRVDDDYEAFARVFLRIAPITAGIRRAGSAALDLAYVAAGRLDGFWETGLKPWDMAAGSLIALEAGALVTDFAGGQKFLDTGAIVAATPKIFPAILKSVKD